jgi:FMN-dependent NADH-azoreductase
MNGKTPFRVLRIDSSARHDDSVSRELGDAVVRRLRQDHPGMTLSTLDLGEGMPHIDGDWVAANLTPAERRTDEQVARLRESDAAVEQLRQANAVVMTVPIYNFSVPSVLKAWIDHVCRAGLTFRYTGQGPQGLLQDRPVYLVMASGGVAFGSAADFASGYLQQVFRFLGIEDVRLIGAEGVARDPAGARAAARQAIDGQFGQSATAVA